jgi:hypothetical protein
MTWRAEVGGKKTTLEWKYWIPVVRVKNHIQE